MKQRCEYPKHRSYKNYGGRGIKVCDEWHDDFQVFHDWAIAAGYKDGLTIDRVDNDGGYTPDNCQWITAAENARKAREK
jgi:hypothetical protein